MKPTTQLYLKTFAWMGIPFGLMMAGMDMVETHTFPVWKFIAHSLFLGIAMSGTFVTFHIYRVRQQGVKEPTAESLTVRQKRTIISTVAKSEFLQRLKNDPVLKTMKWQESGDGFSLRSGVTWKSWGERVVVAITPIGENQYEYVVSSSPRIPTTIIDYGKNLENVNRIERLL